MEVFLKPQGELLGKCGPKLTFLVTRIHYLMVSLARSRLGMLINLEDVGCLLIPILRKRCFAVV